MHAFDLKKMRTRMKLKIALSIAMMLSTGIAHGQVTNIASTITHNNAVRDARKVTVDVPIDFMKDALKNFVDERYNANVQGLGFLANDDEVTVEHVVDAGIHPDTFDMFLHFEKLGERSTSVSIAARTSPDSYFSTRANTTSMGTLGSMLSVYATHAANDFYSTHVEDVRERKDDLIKEIDKARRDIADANDNIQKNLEENEDLKKEITELQTQIGKLEEKLDATRSELEASQGRLQELQQ